LAASASFCKAFQMDPEKAQGCQLAELGDGEWRVRSPSRGQLRSNYKRLRWSRLFGQFSPILKWKVCFSV